MKKLIFIGITILSLSTMSITALADWQQSGNTWKYNNGGKYLTGWWKIGDSQYYFDQNETMITGWKFLNGAWYFFNADGSMAHDQWIGNYYVGSNGIMATNTWVGNYYVGSDGAWIPENTGTGMIQDNCIANLRNSGNEYFVYGIQGLEDTGDYYKVKCTVGKAVTVSSSFEKSRKIGERVKIGNYSYTVTHNENRDGFYYVRDNDGYVCYLIQNTCPNGNATMRYMDPDSGEGWLFDGNSINGYVYIAKTAEVRLIDSYNSVGLLGNMPLSVSQYANGDWNSERIYSLAQCPGWIETDANGIIQRLTALYDD